MLQPLTENNESVRKEGKEYCTIDMSMPTRTTIITSLQALYLESSAQGKK